MERLTTKYNEENVAKEICTINRFGEADDCSSCAEICEECNSDCENCAIQKCFDKLASYEDAEEQGLLLRLPCKVGDVVAIVLMIPSTGKRCIEQAEVKEINIGKYNTREDIQLKVEPIARRGTVYKYYVSEWGENIFPTLSEAEKALADMGV